MYIKIEISKIILQTRDLTTMQGRKLINPIQLILVMFNFENKYDLSEFYEHLIYKEKIKQNSQYTLQSKY